MKKVSSGTIIVNEHAEILMGRITHSNPVMWDLPKGLIEPEEDAQAAAIRECEEEFGLILDATKIKNLGIHQYNREKNLWLGLTFLPKHAVDLSALKCRTTFYDRREKQEILEIDAYSWIPLQDVSYDCCASMCRVLTKLSDVIMLESTYGDFQK